MANARSFNNATLNPAEVNGLKKKSVSHPHIQVRIQGVRYDFDVEAHVLTTPDKRYAFFSLQPINAVVGQDVATGYHTIDKSERDNAVRALKAIRRMSATKAKPAAPELSPEL